MVVMKGAEHHWWNIAFQLRVLPSKRQEIDNHYQSDCHKMEAMVDHYIKFYPTTSWKDVSETLQQMRLHKQADEVATKYVKGMDINHVTYLVLNQVVGGQLWNFFQNNMGHNNDAEHLMRYSEHTFSYQNYSE